MRGDRMETAPTPEAQESESQRVLTRVALGDPSALERLYALYASKLLGVILSVVKNRPDAEEVLQETFLDVWSRANRYDAQRASVGTWLTIMARTRAIDRIRRTGADARRVNAVSLEQGGTDLSGVPQDALEQHQTNARVRAALQMLPEDQRAVLQLAYLEGLSHSEISEQTGIPLGTVKTRIRLAMKKLAGLL